MARTKDVLRIEVSENAAEDMRHITVTIIAPAKKFMLADLLKQRGAIEGLDADLRKAVRETVQDYIDRTENLVAVIAAGQRKPRKGSDRAPGAAVKKGAEEFEVVNGSVGVERGEVARKLAE